MLIRRPCDPLMPELHLFHSRRKYARFCMSRLGVHANYGSDAETTYKDGVAVVLFAPHMRADLASDFALIAHEAYHVVCAHMDRLGEDDAGEEVMAYLIQAVSGELCAAHVDWMAHHGRQSS